MYVFFNYGRHYYLPGCKGLLGSFWQFGRTQKNNALILLNINALQKIFIWLFLAQFGTRANWLRSPVVMATNAASGDRNFIQKGLKPFLNRTIEGVLGKST
jgi:hypothetical protein